MKLEESGHYTGHNAASAPYCSDNEESYESPHQKRALSVTSDQELELNSRGSWFNHLGAKATNETPSAKGAKPRTRSRRIVKKEAKN